MFDPSKVNWDDPRIAPYLQELADSTFARLMTLAQEKGIPLAGTLPFDVMNEDIGNTWKACIIRFLEELMPDPRNPSPRNSSSEPRRQANGG